jgi:hypothetical protein
MTTPQNKPEQDLFDDAKNADEALKEKLVDAMTPGYQAEFDPDEAERCGAFVEEALSEEDAAESVVDLDDGVAAHEQEI